MKKISVLVVAFCAAVSLTAQNIVNDPEAEKRNVGSFHAIQVSNAFDVYLTQGNEEALAVSASKPEYKDRIITKVENGVLIIKFDNENKFWKGWNGDKLKLKVYIAFKNIDKLNVSGACDVRLLTSLKAADLRIQLSGASDFKMETSEFLNVDKLDVEISGASDITLRGKAGQLKIDASGASDFKGYDLVTTHCEAEASGASSIQITVSKELSAVASGASSVYYKGEGLIRNIKTSGASSISRKS